MTEGIPSAPSTELTSTEIPHVRWDHFAQMVTLNEITGCLLWRGTTDADGYGIFSAGRPYRAHRVSYTMAIGPIPDGLVLDHLCANPRCVNPDHLEAVTPAVNNSRAQELRPPKRPRSGPRQPYGPRDPERGYSERQRRRLNKAS